MAEDQAPERYFYHSFPRRGRDTGAAIDRGCRILSMIRDYGLLMAPEVVRWEYSHADGTAPRSADTLQRRACFTELAPHELLGHADLFGSFALEFDIPVGKSFGAIPVFYIPRALTEAKGAEGAASTLVMQLLDAMVLAERVAAIQERQQQTGQTEGEFRCKFGFAESGSKEFVLDAVATSKVLAAVTHALTPAPDLHQALQGITNFFYPADDVQGNNALRYYREREWRLGWRYGHPRQRPHGTNWPWCCQTADGDRCRILRPRNATRLPEDFGGKFLRLSRVGNQAGYSVGAACHCARRGCRPGAQHS